MCLAADRIESHGRLDVFQHALANILEPERRLASHLPERIIGQVNPAWFALVFDAGCNVDAVTEDVVFIENNVPDVNANSEFDPLILRQKRILLGHRPLSFHATAYGIY